jgi:hypothetical protein
VETFITPLSEIIFYQYIDLKISGRKNRSAIYPIAIKSINVLNTSDLSQVFEMDDIFTRKDAISGLKSSPWAGLGKLVNTPLDSSIFAGRYHNLQYWFSDSIYIAVKHNH